MPRNRLIICGWSGPVAIPVKACGIDATLSSAPASHRMKRSRPKNAPAYDGSRQAYRVRVSGDPSDDEFWHSQVDACRVQAAHDADAVVLKTLDNTKTSWCLQLKKKLDIAESHSATISLASISSSCYDLLLQQCIQQ